MSQVSSSLQAFCCGAVTAKLTNGFNLLSGSWTTPTFTSDGFEAVAVTRDESQGKIWLCLESSATK